MTASIRPVDQPRPFADHELFFSITDTKGRILYGNEVFCRIAGYEEHELVGRPHNVIRHPDMPRSVFRLLWDYLEAGKTIAAYVKNMASDGRYYWVLAAVTPCRGGYLSVRLKPGSRLFHAAQSIYAEALAMERAVEPQSGRREAIDRSLELLLERLDEAGFPGYDRFMCTALAEELARRDTTPTPPGGDPFCAASGAIVQRLTRTFHSLHAFRGLSAELAERERTLRDLGPSLAYLALNAHVASSRRAADGAVLSVVSRSLRDQSKVADAALSEVMRRLAATCERAEALAFETAVCQLESQVCDAFAHELSACRSDGRSGPVRGAAGTLVEELGGRGHAVLERLAELNREIEGIDRAAADLDRQIGRMRMIHLNGKIEASTVADAAIFEGIFDDVAEVVRSASQESKGIDAALAAARDRVRAELAAEAELRGALDTLAASAETLHGEPALA